METSSGELELVKLLLEQNRHLTQQVMDLAKEALQSRLQTPTQLAPAYEPIQGPMTVPETEEDARAMWRAGLIDDDALAASLNEIGFYNSEMIVPN